MPWSSTQEGVCVVLHQHFHPRSRATIVCCSFLNEDALAQCLVELKKPAIEVHYGNVFAKGKTSKVTCAAAHSSGIRKALPTQVAGACGGIVMGLKLRGYELAMEAAAAALRPDYRDFDYPAAPSS